MPPADASVASDTSGRRLITPTFAFVTLAALGYFLAIGMMLPVLPRYVEDQLGGDGIAVGIVVGAFAFTAAISRPVVGRLGDVRGRRVLAVGGAALAAASLFPFGLIHAIWFLIVMRLVAGFGEAAFFVGAATAIQDLAPPDRRGEAASYFSLSLYGGLAFGPFIGERLYLDHGPGWTWFAAGSACVLAMLSSTQIPSDLGRRSGPPPRRSLLHAKAVRPGVVILFGLLGYAGYATFLPLYVDDLGVPDAGRFFLVYGCVVLAVRLFGATIPDRLGPVRSSTIALVCIGVGTTIVGVVQTVSGVWIGTVLMALGMSLLFPGLFAAAVDGVADDERSHAVGTFSLFFDISQGLGAPVLGLLVTVFSTERAAFLGGAGGAAIALVLANTVLRSSVGEQSGTARGPFPSR